jgi:hypothetical protein
MAEKYAGQEVVAALNAAGSGGAIAGFTLDRP